MKKQLIALFGSSGQGKTTVLKGLISELKNNKNFSFIGYDEKYNEQYVDVVAIFEYKNILIGISTAGDVRKIIRERVGDCLINKHQCDVIFTASRTKGETCDELNTLSAQHDYNLIWVDKLYRTYDPMKKKVKKENIYLDDITKIEIKYLFDYLFDYVLE